LTYSIESILCVNVIDGVAGPSDSDADEGIHRQIAEGNIPVQISHDGMRPDVGVKMGWRRELVVIVQRVAPPIRIGDISSKLVREAHADPGTDEKA
jgi:hypothetical protein